MSRKIAPIFFLIGLIFLGSGILLAQIVADSGILSEITSITIGDDEIPVISFTLTDINSTPLSLDEVDSVRFLLVRIDEDELSGLPRYYNYFSNEVAGTEYEFNGTLMQPTVETVTQPTFESGDGTFAEVEPGVYTYTFSEPLGDNYDDRLTHLVAAEVIRGPRNVAANPYLAFDPRGGEADDTQFLVETASCNNCHGDLRAHGGSRYEVNLCTTCHTPDNSDPETGNSLDFRVLIHRIHAGENLPSVQEGLPYYIVGRNGSIHDYSTVAFPQDIRNCTSCHTGVDFEDNLEAEVPTCTSCHDDVDPTIGLNHPGRPKDEDSCANCHYPELEEFDNESIPGAHVIPRHSEQLNGVNFEIITVENVVSGQSPAIIFRVTDDAGEVISVEEMGYLAVTLAGPVSDYTERTTETIFRAGENAEPPAIEETDDGAFRYTFSFVFADDTSGTYAFAMEGYVMQELDDIDEVVRDTGFNPVTYVGLNGEETDARRQVIALENCNSCHSDLALHGTIRQNTEYCVLCHNPNATDENRRPDEAMPPVSINFPLLIHRIHNGEEANNPLQVYGFGNNLHDYGELRFPGEMLNCSTCHIDNSYSVLPEGNAPTVISQGGEVLVEIQASRAVCSTCHDTLAADGHAILQTTDTGIETCSVCHGSNREFDITNIHP